MEYRALVMEYRALLMEYRALLMENRSLLIEYRTLCKKWCSGIIHLWYIRIVSHMPPTNANIALETSRTLSNSGLLV